MVAGPDIIIRERDTPEVLLAIEVNAGALDTDASATPLKAYMVRRQCPAGIFVTAEEALFLRNWYTSYEVDSVQPIASCTTTELLGIRAEGISEAMLLELVENWLENLGASSARSFPSAAREAIEWHIVPAVIEGVVQATGPKLRPAG